LEISSPFCKSQGRGDFVPLREVPIAHMPARRGDYLAEALFWLKLGEIAGRLFCSERDIATEGRGKPGHDETHHAEIGGSSGLIACGCPWSSIET
jgi:hypothetical protein